MMAGALGFEPRSSVLETDSLTVELTPLCTTMQAERTASPPAWRLLLRLFMIRVLSARIAKLRKLQPTRRCLLVLCGGVVTVLTLGALQRDDFAHGYILSSLASHIGWQAAAASKTSLIQHAATQG